MKFKLLDVVALSIFLMELWGTAEITDPTTDRWSMQQEILRSLKSVDEAIANILDLLDLIWCE